jgi:hypothetical protein
VIDIKYIFQFLMVHFNFSVFYIKWKCEYFLNGSIFHHRYHIYRIFCLKILKGAILFIRHQSSVYVQVSGSIKDDAAESKENCPKVTPCLRRRTVSLPRLHLWCPRTSSERCPRNRLWFRLLTTEKRLGVGLETHLKWLCFIQHWTNFR